MSLSPILWNSKISTKQQKVNKSQVLVTSPIPHHTFQKSFSSLRKYINTNENYLKFRIKRLHSKTFHWTSPEETDPLQKTRALKQIATEMKYVKTLIFTKSEFKKISNIVEIFQRTRRITSITSDVKLVSSSVKHSDIKELFKCLCSNLISFRITASKPSSRDLLSSLIKNIFLSLKRMSNLRSFHFLIGNRLYLPKCQTFQLTEADLETDEDLIERLNTQFQRLSNLEDVEFSFQLSPNLIYKVFLQSFGCLQNLKVLKLRGCLSKEYKNSLIDKIKQNTSLRSLIFYDLLDPEDIISIVSAIPTLKQLTGQGNKRFIMNASDSFPAPYQAEFNLISLHLDFLIEINNTEEATFISSIIAPLCKLESLMLLVQINKDDCSVNPIMNVINSKRGLRELKLGLITRSGLILSQGFDQIQNLTKIEKLSLVLKLPPKGKWESDIQEAILSIARIIFQNKKLINLELFVQKMSVQNVLGIAEIIKGLPELSDFLFGLSPPSKNHDDSHQLIVEAIKRIFNNFDKARETVIRVSCQSAQNCDIWDKEVEESISISMKKSISFKFIGSQRVETSFYKINF